MLVDSLSCWNKYDLGPVWKKIMSYLETQGEELDLGVHQVDNCRIMVTDSQTKLPGEGRFEWHEKMADVQLVLKGEEIMYYAPTKVLTPQGEFNFEKDLGFFKEQPEEIANLSSIKLHPDTFALLLPWDGHMPLIAIGERTVVRKIVVKIPLAELEL